MMGEKNKIYVKLIHCGNVNIANPKDKEQKNVFFMPMGLFPLANTLKENKVDVEILHLDLECDQEITEILDFDKLDIVGFDCHWINQSLVVLDTAELIKKYNPNVFIFLGGFSASLFAEEIVSNYPQIDAVIRGDGEIPIVELCKSIQDQKFLVSKDKEELGYTLDQVQNLVWKQKGKTYHNKFSYVGTPEEMDKLDFAAFELLRNWESYRGLSRYYSSFGTINAEPMYLLEIGRGCEYACTFCGGNCVAQKIINNRKGATVRSIEKVVQSIKKAKRMGFGTLYTCFEFTGSDQWFIHLLNHLKEEKIEMNYGYGCWKIPSNELVDALSECCKKVVIEISPETGDERLRKLNKDNRIYYSNEELERCLDYIQKKENVKVQLFFGYYLVQDKEETILKTIEYILKLLIKYEGLLEIEYANFSTDPGSLIFLYPEKYEMNIKVRNFRDYIHNLKENYVEVKRKSPDLTLFSPQNMSSKEIAEVDRKVRLFNWIFYTFRHSVSYILQKTKVPDLLMEILKEEHLTISEEMKFAPEAVRDGLITICNKHFILDDYLSKTINMEYLAQKSERKISKPTTQLYLVGKKSERVCEGHSEDKGKSVTDSMKVDFEFSFEV